METNTVGERLRLSLCMIVRDSAETLPACLESIKPWVDEMVVVDTGSNDNTREIAADFGARVFEFPWPDSFSIARNESIRHARGEWIYWMDSDDTITPENGRKLRELADNQHADSTLGYVMQVHCPGGNASSDVTVVDHVKLFRNLPSLEFEFRIHEQLLPSIRRLEGDVEWTDIFVVHSGSDQSAEGKQRKYDRDLRLLILELEDRPEHPFALFNVGMTYADMEQWAEADGYLRRSIDASEPGESHLRKAYALLVNCLAQLDRTDEALRICEQGLSQFTDDPELSFRRGILTHKLGRHDEAIAAYRTAMKAQNEQSFSSRDAGITGFKARHNLALVYADANQHDLAELQWREAVCESPKFRPAWLGLSDSLIRQGKVTTAEVEAERLLRDANLRPLGLMFQSEVSKHRGDIDQARVLLEEAMSEFPDDLDVLHARARFLFEHGPPDEACKVLTQLSMRQPNDAAIWHNLGAVHTQLSDYDKAIECLERSLKLRPGWQTTQQQITAAQRLRNEQAVLPTRA